MEESLKTEPHLRLAQKALAKEVVIFLHGEEEYEKAVRLTEALFSNDFSNLKANEIEEIFSKDLVRDIDSNLNLVDLLISMNIASSKREAREFINGNAISVNGNKVNDVDLVIDDKYFIDNKYVIIKRGKKNYYIGRKK